MIKSGLVLGFAMVLAGCGTSSPRFSGADRGGYPAVNSASGPCHSNPAGCIHKGSYESGERLYAQHEAERLNQLSLERLRRGAGR